MRLINTISANLVMIYDKNNSLPQEIKMILNQPFIKYFTESINLFQSIALIYNKLIVFENSIKELEDILKVQCETDIKVEVQDNQMGVTFNKRKLPYNVGYTIEVTSGVFKVLLANQIKIDESEDPYYRYLFKFQPNPVQ